MNDKNISRKKKKHWLIREDRISNIFHLNEKIHEELIMKNVLIIRPHNILNFGEN